MTWPVYRNLRTEGQCKQHTTNHSPDDLSRLQNRHTVRARCRSWVPCCSKNKSCDNPSSYGVSHLSYRWGLGLNTTPHSCLPSTRTMSIVNQGIEPDRSNHTWSVLVC